MDMINIPAIDIIMQSIGSADARELGDASDVVNEIASTSFLDVMLVESMPTKGANDRSDMAVLVDVPKVTMPDIEAAKPAPGFGVAIQQPEIVQHEAGEISPTPDIKQPNLWTASVTAAVAYQNSTPPLADKNTVLPVRQAEGIAASPLTTPVGSDRLTIPVEADLATDSKTQTLPVQQIQAQPRSAENPTASTLTASQPADKAAIIFPTARTKTKAAEYLPVKAEPATITKPTGPSIIPDLKTAQTPAPLDTTKPSIPKLAELSAPRPAPTAPHASTITNDLPQSTPLDAVTKVTTNQQGTQIIAAPDKPSLQAQIFKAQPISAPPEYPLGSAQTYLRPAAIPVAVLTPAQIAPVAGPPVTDTAPPPKAGTDLVQVKSILAPARNLKLEITPSNQSPQVQPADLTAAPQLTKTMLTPRSETGQTDPAIPNTPTPAPQPEQGLPAQNTTTVAMPEQIIGADDIMPLITDTRQTDALVPRLDTLTPRAEVARHIAQQLANVAQQMPDRPIELTLNPEELGRVRLTFTVSDGAISVAVLAERGETLDLMRRHIETLAQEFRNQGYKDVNFEFSRGGQQGNAGSSDGANDDSKNNADSGPATSAFADPDISPPVKLSLEPATGLDLRL